MHHQIQIKLLSALQATIRSGFFYHHETCSSGRNFNWFLDSFHCTPVNESSSSVDRVVSKPFGDEDVRMHQDHKRMVYTLYTII